MTRANALRELCPPLIWRQLKRFNSGGIRYMGPFETWARAAGRAQGYDSQAILERVVAATRKVVRGEAAMERDSVLFQELEYPSQLLAPMLQAALQDAGALNVLDYGGSLGSTYRSCRSFLSPARVSWSVVEQPAFVQAGRAEFENEELRFFPRVEDVPHRHTLNIVLFASVLQYLDQPYDALAQATSTGARYLIIERTPFASRSADVCCVQHVPASIYPASYPLWIFSRKGFLERLSTDWTLVADFPAAEGTVVTSKGMPFEFRGLILQKRHAK